MGISWMKKGADSAALAKQNEAEAEKRKSEQGKMFRWWLKDGESGHCTFVDGDLSPDGYLLPPRFYEHKLYLNGSWDNHFVCPEKTNPESGEKCPICESGDRPTLVALFTVIDHRVFKSKKEGQPDITNRRKLLVANAQAFEILNKIAMKRGGLVGARFEVSRVGEKTPNVGSMFDFEEKTAVETLKTKYTRTTKDKDGKDTVVCDFEAADYEKEIIFRTADQLRELGLGKPGAGSSGIKPGAAGAPQGKPMPPAQQSSAADYEKEL